MLDINFVRENVDKVKKSTAAKQVDPSLVDKVLELDKRRRELIGKIEELRAKRNEIAKQKEKTDAGREVKDLLKKLEPELKGLEAEYQSTLFLLPNPAVGDVKEGKDDTENEIIRSWGVPKEFSFRAKDHLELGEALGIIDVERAAKISGSRFAYLKGDGVRLEFALIQYAFDVLSKKGFVPVIPPVLIKKESMQGMGYMEHGGADNMYVLDEDGMILVGTSEQSVGPMYMGETIDASKLPLRYMGFSSCFRREAGTYGKDTRGILRVHQFDKVEMFSFTKQEESEGEHELLLSLEEELFQGLSIPYQVSKMCTGDLGLPAARKYDINAWMPGQGKFREVTSTSTCTDFQARRLNIKYQDGSKTKYIHMLNGTGFAIGRTIIAILENYQQEDGTIEVPEILRKWMGKDKIT